MVKGILYYISSSQELLITSAADFAPCMMLNINILIVSAAGHTIQEVSNIGLNLLVTISNAIPVLLTNHLLVAFCSLIWMLMFF